MNPYFLKTALFREMDETLDWSSRYVGCRLMGVLTQLDRARAVAKLPHYYMPDVNLMRSYSTEAIIARRLKIYTFYVISI